MRFVQQTLEFMVTLFFKVFFLFFPQKDISPKLQEAITFYKGEGFGELFQKVRVWDAPYEEINKRIANNAKVLDLGCGDGLLANYLALSSPKRKVYGIDINKGRLKKAYKGLKNTKFKEGNILKEKVGKFDVVTLIHVLHHLPGYESQVELLEKVKSSLNKNGELIILEIDKKPILKYLFTYFTDVVTVPILFERRLFDFNIFYRDSNKWKEVLRELRFDVQVTRIDKGMPFSHVLIYAKKLV